MKKIFSLHLYLTLFAYSVPPQPTTVHVRTAHIYYRYYLIKRLEKSCHFLFSYINQDLLPNLLDITLYQSSEIISKASMMKEEKSIKPLELLWQDFCGYAYIYDKAFTTDFVKLIYTLCKSITRSNYTVRTNKTEELLTEIDRASDSFFYHTWTRAYSPSTDTLPHEVTVDMIARRFYILKRIQKSVASLEDLHAAKFTFSNRRNLASFAHDSDIEHFQHFYIRETIEQMNQTNDLEPFINLCGELKQYRFAHDEHFLQEMLMQMFLVYKTILFKHYNAHELNASIVHEMNHVLDIYERIDSLSLDETLEAIDLATDRLIAIQNEQAEYRFNFRQWVFPLASAIGVAAIGWYLFYTGEISS